jgi:hypothetical protein
MRGLSGQPTAAELPIPKRTPKYRLLQMTEQAAESISKRKYLSQKVTLKAVTVLVRGPGAICPVTFPRVYMQTCTVL